MSSVVQKPKLLIVDTSPSMAQVLSTYALFEEYPTDTICDPADACVALTRDHNYQCVVLGWPEGKINIIADLLKTMSEPEHSKLPLVVISQKSTEMINALSTSRADTKALLWKNYRELGQLVEELVIAEAVKPTPVPVIPMARQILFVSDNPSQVHELQDLLRNENHQVYSARNATKAKTVLKNQQVDLVICDFYLQDESAEDLCEHVKRMDVAPVFAVMTDRNLDEVVQRSLRAGAITCINKAEPIDNLFPRLDAIIKGLPSLSPSVVTGNPFGNGDHVPGTVESVADHTDPSPVKVDQLPEPIDRLPGNVDNHAETIDPVSRSVEQVISTTEQLSEPVDREKTSGNQVLLPLKGLLELSNQPAILLDSRQRIVAANQKAQDVLSPAEPAKLLNNESLISLAGLDQTGGSGKAVLSTVAGEEIKVEYHNKKLRGESNGVIEDYDHLTFEVLKIIPETVESDTSAKVEDRASTEEKAKRLTLQQAISAALTGGQVVSLLMVDIKMIAAVTGDRLSLGMSEPMLGMVREKLAEQYPRQNALTYVGNGRFVLLLETQRVEQALNLSKKLVNSIPTLINGLGDVELVSHGAFLRIPDQSSMTSDYMLKHCTAACLKAELDGRDNSIYVIGKEPWQRKTKLSVSKDLPGRRVGVRSRDLGVSLAG